MLLAMHRVRDKTALWTAGVIYAVVTASLVISALFLDRSAFMPTRDEALSSAVAQTQAMLGSPAEIIGHNVSGLELLVLQAASLQGPTALARSCWAWSPPAGSSNLSGQESFLWWTQWIGFPVGLAELPMRRSGPTATHGVQR